MFDQNPSQEAQAGGATNVPSSDGGMNGSEVVELKDILGPAFGTQFKSNEDALKSVVEAKNMSGKVGQLENTVKELETKLASANSPELEAKVNQALTMVKEQSFYAQNPEYNTPEAKALITKFGGNPEAVVQDDVFKTAFGAIKSAKEQESSKSVLMSNPRLGQVQDKMTHAQEAMKAGNQSAAAASAVSAVIESFKPE